ncbi:MAG: SPASM domain-containing protein [Candidatus Kryptoniota bacterium]
MKVSLNTNGCCDSKILTRILNARVKELIISIDGREKTHDNRRGLGTFKRVIRTLNQVYKYNQNNFGNKVKAILNVAAGKDNIQDTEYLVYLGVKYGYDVKFVPLKPGGRAYNKNFMLSAREYMEFAKKVQQLRENPKIKESKINIILNHKDLFNPQYPNKSDLPYPFNYSQCTALTTAMDILPDGKVVACSFLMDKPEFIGPNILDISVYDAWRHPTMERFRQVQKQDCANCRFYMRQCRGPCRSCVLLNDGKIEGNELIGTDPYCFKDLLL